MFIWNGVIDQVYFSEEGRHSDRDTNFKMLNNTKLTQEDRALLLCYMHYFELYFYILTWLMKTE